jgi:hypothetical protein
LKSTETLVAILTFYNSKAAVRASLARFLGIPTIKAEDLQKCPFPDVTDEDEEWPTDASGNKLKRFNFAVSHTHDDNSKTYELFETYVQNHAHTVYPSATIELRKCNNVDLNKRILLVWKDCAKKMKESEAEDGDATDSLSAQQRRSRAQSVSLPCLKSGL